jgi:hypothetical protein
MARFFIPTTDVVPPAPMRGAISRQTPGLVEITEADTYVPINLGGQLDSDVSVNMSVSGSPNITGLKNDVGQKRTVVVIASYDGKAGNNQVVGCKIAINGVPVDESECTSFSGSSAQFSKTMTQWMVEIDAGDELTMMAANKTANTDIEINRFKMIAYAI